MNNVAENIVRATIFPPAITHPRLLLQQPHSYPYPPDSKYSLHPTWLFWLGLLDPCLPARHLHFSFQGHNYTKKGEEIVFLKISWTQSCPAYTKQHNQVAGIGYMNICTEYQLDLPKSRWEIPQKFMENKKTKFLLGLPDPDRQIGTNQLTRHHGGR